MMSVTAVATDGVRQSNFDSTLLSVLLHNSSNLCHKRMLDISVAFLILSQFSIHYFIYSGHDNLGPFESYNIRLKSALWPFE